LRYRFVWILFEFGNACGYLSHDGFHRSTSFRSKYSAKFGSDLFGIWDSQMCAS
jgi:hypothetical protein